MTWRSRSGRSDALLDSGGDGDGDRGSAGGWQLLVDDATSKICAKDSPSGSAWATTAQASAATASSFLKANMVTVEIVGWVGNVVELV